MNPHQLPPDDPKLTAYALGELSGDERAAVEAALRQQPELRPIVEEIRVTVARLEAALAAEAASQAEGAERVAEGGAGLLNGHFTAVPPSRRRRRAPGRDPVEAVADEPPVYPFPRPDRTLLRFPQFYYVAAGAAAAGFAILVALRDEPLATSPGAAGRRAVREIALAPATPRPAELAGPEAAVADVRLTGAGSADVTGVVAEPTPSGADAVKPTPAPTRFVEGDLSLLAQARPDRDDGAGAKGATAPAEPAVAPRSPPFTKITLNATAPAPVGSTVGVMVGPLGPGTTTITTTVTAAPGTSEIVTLSAFVVSADRASGFATSGAYSPADSGRRHTVDRDERPSAPPGAKFGRNTEAYAHVRDNDFLPAARNRRSTFAIDVDTASYANVRRIIDHGTPPPADAVRIEEMLNYFPYRYAAPKGGDPFAVSLEVAEAPWAPQHRLVRIGLKAREVTTAQRPAANLVFLLDVSGSMDQPNKLPLVKQSMRLLVGRLRPDDRVAIVTYAGSSGLALPSTPVAQSREILNALDSLTPGGSTNGAMGIQLAYDIAKANFAAGGINRVILCTDGDFNVGPASEGELVRMIEEKAGSGVFLTVLGFGMGDYKDATLEKLAGRGNGNYGYIDTRREAEKLLVEQVSSTLVTVAKDVKVQVEFNPAKVHSYRLIGYENRPLRKEDFNDDRADAGELGAGDTVTALYEIVPVGAERKGAGDPAPLAPLRYGAGASSPAQLAASAGAREASANELLTVNVRYKKPDSFISWPRTLQFPLVDTAKAFAQASADFRFAAAVAEFGMILRGSPHRGQANMHDVGAWASTAAAPEDDPGGYRVEFVELVRKIQAMME